jgi:hypothetical protein
MRESRAPAKSFELGSRTFGRPLIVWVTSSSVATNVYQGSNIPCACVAARIEVETCVSRPPVEPHEPRAAGGRGDSRRRWSDRHGEKLWFAMTVAHRHHEEVVLGCALGVRRW